MSDPTSEPFQPPSFPSESESALAFVDDDDDEEQGEDINRVSGAFNAVEGDDDDDDEEQGEDVNRVSGGTASAVLDHVARAIVEEPDAVVIEASEGRGQTRLSLHVAPGDMGRVIGKRGRVAQAIRTVVRAAAARDGADASVDIVD